MSWDIPSAIIGSHEQLKKIATATFSKLGPLNHIHIRDIGGPHTHARCASPHPIESTMLLDITMSNGVAFHFGKWKARGCDVVHGTEGAMGVTLPGLPMAFLCKHRIITLAATYEVCPYAAERNRNLWVQVAKMFDMNLAEFESFVQLAAAALGKATGIVASGYEEQWISQFKAPVRTKVVTYIWE